MRRPEGRDYRETPFRSHNLPASLELYRKRLLDGCFVDTHNSVTGNYGGAAIRPDAIALNLLGILDYERGTRQA